MIQAYLNERYGDNLELDWDEYLKRYELDCHKTYYGFVTYKMQGDCGIIYDMYVKPEFRKHTYAWLLHDYVLKLAKSNGKRCFMTFSDFKGKNHMAGIKAMKVAGFIPAFKTNEEFVFIKGI